jgi:pimeloyl-ACP methyl ester carboxylesterase
VSVGDHDELTPPERAVETANCNTGSRIATVPQSGHSCALEQPDYVTRELVSFLTDNG